MNAIQSAVVLPAAKRVEFTPSVDLELNDNPAGRPPRRRLRTTRAQARSAGMTDSSRRIAPSQRRRKAAGRFWSATSSIQWLDTTGATLARTAGAADAPRGAVKAKVHYRIGGLSKKPTFAGPDLLERVTEFQAMLLAAHHGNWRADQAGRPVPPSAFPAVAPAPVADQGAEVDGTSGDAEVLRLHPATRALPSPARGVTHRDIPELVRWFLNHQRTTSKRRGGRRSPNTVNGYQGHLKFLEDHAVYGPGDPRLDMLGLAPGSPLRCDEPATGVSERDLVLLLELRATTNLRVRAANQRKVERWAAAVQREEQRSAGSGDQPTIPHIPELRTETTSDRTVEAFAQAVSAMFSAAYKRGLISYQPWTPTVDDEVKHPAGIHYTAKTLPGRHQVNQVAAAMASYWRRSISREGYPVSVSGGRYSAMVWLAGREGPRPEETIAIRDSWVILDDDPRIELHHAEVYHPNPDGPGRIRAIVPLKHRAPGDIRIIRPDVGDRDEFVRLLSGHREQYVSNAEAESADDRKRDPYFFTTHWGEPVDLSNWSEKWWQPVVSECFAEGSSAQFATLPFRRLRAAAITDWLVELGYSTEQASTKAGNTQAVLERHYKGVLGVRKRPLAAPATPQDLVLALVREVESMDDAQLGVLGQTVRGVLRRRLDADEEVR